MAAVRTGIYLQVWVLIAGFIAFVSFVGYDQGYFAQLVEADSTGLSLVIVMMFIAATVHAAWHILRTTQRIEAARGWLAGNREPPPERADCPEGFCPVDYNDYYLFQVRDPF